MLGERGWLVSADLASDQASPAYEALLGDFTGELSMFANIVSGDTPDTGPNASPDQAEYDLTVDYRATLASQPAGAVIDTKCTPATSKE